MAATTKTQPVRKKRNRLPSDNGEATSVRKIVDIPRLKQAVCELVIIGDRPLMVNNKLSVAERVSEQYSGRGKAGAVAREKPTDDENYIGAFYVMSDSKQPAPHKKGRYGIPASGIKKCACSAIRTTGITDNTTIGLIRKSFWVLADNGGLCLIKHSGFDRDIRPVNIGSGQKTVPQMRHRPIFHDWSIRLKISYNAKVLSEEQLVNLFMHAGQMIGLCEMRAEKNQGECGGFVCEGGGNQRK